ncbi:SRPBCC family protein [Lysinibacter cavernae]|uniref:Uncharacterized protein YndB with AHSA1/START domain n=1 Tax=Lysinibacter cavernae TaxID=1640652 RepID=A0A7X5QZ63_9MICO|nr:SRPBCC domain-containing protein [Lysinibacter cavernae]NIH52472.1 uncharacterized protein YndB with AHSA1/START domain [Lysinibacter cavernae]
MADIFTITRTFRAPAERVYAAWTTPEDFSVWFGTEAINVPLDRLSMDVRVGGTWTAVMELPDGSIKNWAGQFTELDAPQRLAMTLTDMPDEPAGDPLTVDLREEATPDGSVQTVMEFTQPRHGFTDEQVEQVILGYNGFFDTMDRIVSHP